MKKEVKINRFDEEHFKLPEAIYLGYSSHDCESWFKCPICHKKFGCHSEIIDKEGNRGCPHCKTILRGLE